MLRAKTNRRTDKEQYTRSNARCDCQFTYIDETGRNLSTRLTEHKRATKNGDVNDHDAEHYLQTKHQIDWDVNLTNNKRLFNCDNKRMETHQRHTTVHSQ